MNCPKCRTEIIVKNGDKYCPKCGFHYDAYSEEDYRSLETFCFDAIMRTIEINGIRQGRITGFTLSYSAADKRTTLEVTRDETFQMRF